VTWLRARDVIAGEDAVKLGGIKYLPRLDSQSDDDYLGYKSRACFFNATSRTCDGFLGLFLGFAGELQEDKDRWTVFCFRLPPGYSAHAKRGIKNTKEWAIHSCIPPGSGIIVRLIPGSADPVRKGASCQRQNPALPAAAPERTFTRATPHPIRPYI